MAKRTPPAGQTQGQKRAQQALERLPEAQKAATRSQINYDVVQQFRRIAPRAIAELEKMIKSRSVSARERLAAIKLILDRSYGKSPNVSVQIPSDPAELQRLAAAIAAKHSQLPPHTPPSPGGGRGGRNGSPPHTVKPTPKDEGTPTKKKSEDLPTPDILNGLGDDS